MYSVQRELCIVPAGHYKFRYNKQLQRVKQIILIMTPAMNVGQSPPAHNSTMATCCWSEVPWSGQWWEEGSVASIGGSNGQLGQEGRRITGHCHWSTRIQTLHRSLHLSRAVNEPSMFHSARRRPLIRHFARQALTGC